MHLLRLEPAEALGAWVGLSNLLKPAVERGDVPMDGVRDALARDHMSAWVAWDGHNLGAVVTRLESHRLRLTYAAGTKAIVRPALDLLTEAARRAGLTEISFGCRRGFKRWFSDFEATDCPDGLVELRKAL